MRWGDKMEETYRNLLCQEIGKYVLNALGETNFDKKIESSAICALREIQNIMLNDEAEDGYKVVLIEDVLIKYNLDISPVND